MNLSQLSSSSWEYGGSEVESAEELLRMNLQRWRGWGHPEGTVICGEQSRRAVPETLLNHYLSGAFLGHLLVFREVIPLAGFLCYSIVHSNCSKQLNVLYLYNS